MHSYFDFLKKSMSGHSKWHNIKERKGVQDRIRGKIFTIHAKLIALAARAGGDPAKNPALTEAIRKAKKDNVPEDNIERAIRKGSGQDKDSAAILEVVYEGYAPGGVGVIVRALTDNKNRTAPNMRHTFGAHGGSLAETGAVSSFAFKHVGVCTLSLDGRTVESCEEAIIEAGAEDYSIEDDTVRVVTERTDLARVVAALRTAGWAIGEW